MTRIAAIQMISSHDVASNLSGAARLISQTVDAGAKLVVLPENFAIMPMKDAERLTVMEKAGTGPIQDFLYAQAQQHRIWLIGGTVPIVGSQRNKLHAACLLINDRGECVARYDKIHLFDVKLETGEEYCESATIEAGKDIVVTDTPLGRVGLAVCYDLRFPELFRQMLDDGAEIFAVPSAFTATTGKAHWDILVRARAIENLAFLVASAQGGVHSNGRETHGNTIVVNPWGEVLARLAQGPGFVIADIDRKRMHEMRSGLPSIEHRRLRHDEGVANGEKIPA
ncbi:MAG: carbon-nitrogen hydrolase family protein [Acidiferrobacterales bacterium]